MGPIGPFRRLFQHFLFCRHDSANPPKRWNFFDVFESVRPVGEDCFDSKGWWQPLSCPKREEAAERKRGRAGKEERTRPLVPPRT